jgi:hypothetical protein
MNDNAKIITMIFLVSTLAIVSLELRTPLHAQNAQNTSNETSSNSQDISPKVEKVIDSIRNPDFTLVNSTSGIPLYWDDSFGVCGSIFDCTTNSTDGWFGNHSLQLSTRNNTNSTWSWISSQEILVRPNEEYGIIAHMKLNEWATQSHILLYGFNNSTGDWYQIEQCPAGTNGPLKWDVFDCKITIPTNTTAMVLILNAGWSSKINENAVTSFDAIHAYKRI